MTPTPTTDSAVSPVRELRPCPFCQMAMIRTESSAQAGIREPFYEHPDTKCILRVLTFMDRPELVDRWNRRSLDTADGVEAVAFTTQRMLDAMREPDTICGSMWPKAAGDVTIPLYLASRTPNTEMVVKALQWQDTSGQDEDGGYDVIGASADHPLAHYWITYADMRRDEIWLVVRDRGVVIGHYMTMAEAKAAAQADFDQRIRSALASPPSPAEVTFQDRVAEAHVALFHDDPTDIAERRDRFYEEATEAVQSLGMTEDEAHQLVSYTFSRPPGDVRKEIGAAALTLSSLCVVGGWDMMECAEGDLAALRTPEKIAKVRAKRATRHGRGPLPGLDASLQLNKKG